MGVNLKLTPHQAEALSIARAKAPNALDLFRPTEYQEEFFRTMSMDMILEVLLGGSNRAGKSLCATAAVTSMLLNQPVTFRDGSKIYMRPERWRHESIKLWIVGYDWKHIGKTIFRLLFKKDPFRTVRDASTMQWRAWDPSRANEPAFEVTRPGPAFIRPTDIVGGWDGISWENKKENQLSAVDFVHDGTRLELFASTGAKPQGDPVHIIWVDEKIDDEAMYSELMMRLVDYRGRMLWTSWPTTAPSAKMGELEERAHQQAGKKDQTSFAFSLKGSENPFTQSDHRTKIMETLNEEERMARDLGIMGNDRWRVYPRFSKFLHRAFGPDAMDDDDLAKAIRSVNGIPPGWTRYMILDPGTQHPAVLFVAIPPPALGDFVVPYDELYVPRLNAKGIAESVAIKLGISPGHEGQEIEDFIIDARAARQTPLGFDGTIGSNYEKELAKTGVRCRRRGSRFSYGSDNIDGRILRVQAALNVRSNGTVRLRILGCQHLLRQMEMNKWGKDPHENPTDRPSKYQNIDLCNCLEYLISRDDCGYVRPTVIKAADANSPDAVAKAMNKFFGRVRQTKTQSVFCGAGEPPM